MSSTSTSIEWTDATWNPVRGCSRVSEGCRNCYAERQAARFSKTLLVKPFDLAGAEETVFRNLPFRGFAEQTKAGPRWTGRVALIRDQLDVPLRWRKPRRIFVNSMSDLFHERLSDEAIAAVFGVMAACPQHTFQVLTKRPERMRAWFEWVKKDLHSDPSMLLEDAINALGLTVGELGDFYRRSSGDTTWPLPNVWLGTSVEDQATADERIPHLLATPAAVRFVSYEPALGPVDFRRWLRKKLQAGYDQLVASLPKMPSVPSHLQRPPDGLDWLIVGGESGPGARAFNIAWARAVVRQCRDAGVACFVKQLGAHAIDTRRTPGSFVSLRDRKGGDPSEWPEDLRVREFPT